MPIATKNLGSKMPAEDLILQVTVAFAPFDQVLPAVAGLFRAQYGYSRAIDPANERQWARLARLERERKVPTQMGDPMYSVQSVRVVESEGSPEVTVLEDGFGTDPEMLAKLLPGVRFLHLYSEYCRKDAEQHWYSWREGGKIVRHVYFHHNYQYPGWDWQEKGPRQPWEDADRIALKRVSARCDRALMLDYARRLGCDLDAALGEEKWRRAVLLYDISPTDTDDTPPTRLGEEMRREAVRRGFGRGEEDLSFEGFIADNRQDTCVWAYRREMLDAIGKTRSAKRLLEVMVNRDPAPDVLEGHTDQFLWQEVLRRATERYPGAPELAEIKRRAKAETQSGWFSWPTM